MKVKVLRDFMNEGQIVSAGDEIEVTEARAKSLMAHKSPLVTTSVGGMMKGAAKDGKTDPTSSRQTGSPTGVIKQSSSSRVGRPPGRAGSGSRISREAEGERAPRGDPEEL